MARKLFHDGSHLSLAERKMIQKGIESRAAKAHIAHTIGKDPTTVAKEIKKHRTLKPRNAFNNRVICVHLKACGKCIAKCPRFEPPACSFRDRSPGACNGCSSLGACRLDKYLYDAEAAEASYRASLSESREGLSLSEAHREQIGLLAAPLFRQGQSPYQIFSSHQDELGISQRSLYHYIHLGVFKAYGIDMFSLKETVNRRPRKQKFKIRRSPVIYTNHTYKDYLAFCLDHPEVPTTEMDTVYNEPDGPFIQTFIFGSVPFMIGRLHQSRTALSMASALDTLQNELGDGLFSSLFSLLLTDRGSEFEKIPLFEANTQTGEVRLNIFFCDPNRSDQKPHVENNHNYLRDIIPNGVSLKNLTQADLDLAFSHINSAPRMSLLGKTPFELFSFFYGENAAHLLRISEIERDKVILKPYLLRHTYK